MTQSHGRRQVAVAQHDGCRCRRVGADVVPRAGERVGVLDGEHVVAVHRCVRAALVVGRALLDDGEIEPCPIVEQLRVLGGVLLPGGEADLVSDLDEPCRESHRIGPGEGAARARVGVEVVELDGVECVGGARPDPGPDDRGHLVGLAGVDDRFVGPVRVEDEIARAVTQQQIARPGVELARLRLKPVDVAHRVEAVEGCRTPIAHDDLHAGRWVVCAAQLVVEPGTAGRETRAARRIVWRICGASGQEHCDHRERHEQAADGHAATLPDGARSVDLRGQPL